MKLSSLRRSVVSRTIGFSSALATSLMLAGNVLAQTSTTGSSTTTKGGSSTALPNAGTTEITYLIFGVGLILFVLGTVKLAQSFRE